MPGSVKFLVSTIDIKIDLSFEHLTVFPPNLHDCTFKPMLIVECVVVTLNPLSANL